MIMISNIPNIDAIFVVDTDNWKIYRKIKNDELVEIYQSDDGFYHLEYNHTPINIRLSEIFCRVSYGIVVNCKVSKNSMNELISTHYIVKSIRKNKRFLWLNDEKFVQSPKFIWLYSNIYGAVFDINLMRFRKLHQDRDGYFRFTPTHSNTNYACHRFVYECWNNVELSSDITINHLNSIKFDNYLPNLQLATFLENTRYSILHGEKCLERVFDEKDIHKMCQMMVNGFTYREIAKEFNINTQREYHNFVGRLNLLRNKRSAWKDISCQYDFSKYTGNNDPNKRFSSEDILSMHQLRADKTPVKEIARVYNASPKYISGVLTGIKRKKEYDLFVKGSTTIETIAQEKDLSE